MKEVLKIIGLFFAGLAYIFVCSLIEAIFVGLCWNYLMPLIFGLPTITYWQAFVLSLLCGLLFGQDCTINKQ